MILKKIREGEIRLLPFPVSAPAFYPQFSPVLGASESASLNISSEISAQSAVVMDNDSKVILFSKNPNLRFSMASTTKLMTALVGLDYYHLDDKLMVKDGNVEGSVVGLASGEVLTFEDLLYAMLLPSGNDAAMTITQNYPGGKDAFLEAMNKKAASLHLNFTHYGDPAGLDDDSDYTTVIDLARLGSEAIQNPVLAKIVSTKYKDITTASGHTFSLKNINELLGIDGVNGIKTGFTDEAKGVLVISKQIDNQTLIVVVMRSDNRFLDTEKLLSYISGNLVYESIPNK